MSEADLTSEAPRGRGNGSRPKSQMRGMGRVFKRGGSVWIAYCHRGEEQRESVSKAFGVPPGRVKEADGWRLLKQRLGEIEGGRFIGPKQDRVVFGELLDALVIDYKNNGRRSLDTLEAHMKPIRAAFGLDRAVDVTEARIERYKADRLADGKAKATVNRELAAVRRAFALAVRQKRLATMPSITTLAEHNARQGFFERGDFEAVCGHLPRTCKTSPASPTSRAGARARSRRSPGPTWTVRLGSCGFAPSRRRTARAARWRSKTSCGS
jgi:hypothetical protein